MSLRSVETLIKVSTHEVACFHGSIVAEGEHVGQIDVPALPHPAVSGRDGVLVDRLNEGSEGVVRDRVLMMDITESEDAAVGQKLFIAQADRHRVAPAEWKLLVDRRKEWVGRVIFLFFPERLLMFPIPDPSLGGIC